MAARLGQVEALAPLAAAVLFARDIAAAEHSSFTFGAGPHFEVVTVAAGANAEGEQVIQVIINHSRHVRPIAPHPLIVFGLHVDRDVLDVVIKGRPSYALHVRHTAQSQLSLPTAGQSISREAITEL